MCRKGESMEFGNSKGFDSVECDLEIFFGFSWKSCDDICSY